MPLVRDMVRSGCAVMALLVCLLLPATAGGSDRLTAVVLADYPPLFITDSNGDPAGFGTDVLRALCRREGLDCDLIAVRDWKEAIEALRSGKADVIPGIKEYRDLDQEFLFVELFGSVAVTLFVQTGNHDIRGLRDLPGHRVGIGSHGFPPNQEISVEDLDLTVYESVEELLFGLLTGQVDGVVYSEPALRKAVRDLGLTDRIKEVDEMITTVKRGYLLRKGESVLAQRLAKAFASFMTTPEYTEIYRKWWGSPDPFWTKRQIVLSGMGLLILTAIALITWRYFSISALNRGLEEARQKLEASEARLNRAQEMAVIGSFERNLKTGEGLWSEGFFKLMGMEVRKEAPSPEDFIKRVHPEDARRHRRALLDPPPNTSEYSLEFRFLPAGADEYRYAYCHLSYEWAADGTPLKRVGTVQDVTDCKRIETELKKAIQKAEAASYAKSEFLANMSHELRTPLNGAMGMLQILAMDDLSPEHREYVETALSACRGLTQLLGDILDLSKVEAGKLELSNEEFVLSDILASVDETFSYLARDKGLRLECTVADDVPRKMEGDPARLRQILFNLVGNALKFTDQGSVTVEVSLLPDPSPDSCRLLFVVTDTGIGIPDNMIEGIFGAFTQVDGAHTRKYQGTGLGLHIVKRLVQLMDGSISVESELSRGTAIYVAAPFYRVNDIPKKLLSPQQGIDDEIGHKRVLVVEDERTNRLAICRLLQSLGHSVKWAANGLDALQYLAMEEYDLILMDIQMPVMNGLEATDRIRETESLGRKRLIPIIALTAHAMSGDREAFLEAGMNDYLSKPVDLAELKRVLVRAFQKTDA